MVIILIMLKSLEITTTIAALAALGNAQKFDPFPTLSAKRDEVTVSGHSAGAYFAAHLMMTASDTWKGAGCANGGPFDWSLRNQRFVTDRAIADSLDRLEELDQQELIDPLENL